MNNIRINAQFSIVTWHVNQANIVVKEIRKLKYVGMVFKYILTSYEETSLSVTPSK